MCVIIVKKPNIIIPFEKIVSACHVNADGFGISVINPDKTGNEKLTTFTRYNGKGNDPEEVYELMDRYKDCAQFIHLRYTTKGAKSVENCHPFTLLEKPDTTLMFMHNGTLYDVDEEKDESDSAAFVRTIGAPTAEAFYALDGSQCLTNPAMVRVFKQFSGNGIFVVYNQDGLYHAIGKDKGYEHEGWWSSNKYSFDRTHREPAKSYSYSPHYYGDWMKETNDDKTCDIISIKKETKTKSVPFLPSPSKAPSSAEASGKAKSLGYALAEAKRMGIKTSSHVPPDSRPTFCDLVGIDTIDQVMALSEEEIEDIVEEMPEAAVILIMDLLFELYTKKHKAAA